MAVPIGQDQAGWSPVRVLQVPPYVSLTSEDSFRLPQCFLQSSLRDPPQLDLGIFTRYSTRTDGQWLAW